MLKLLKQAAMFGLDARIALAIFGALSIISGAALYSAIQDAKVTALLVDLQELSKSHEQLYLDTGVIFIPLSTDSNTNNSVMNLNILKTSSVSGWKGPYISYDLISYGAGYILDHNTYGEIHIIAINDSNPWGDSVYWSDATNGFCSNTSCYLWVAVNGVPENIANALDVKVDGALDATSGKIRWTSHASGYAVYYKHMPIDNPL